MEILDPQLNINENGLKRRSETTKIVIHHTGSATDDDTSAAEIDRMHKGNGWDCIGYHFVIRKNGAIEKGRPVWAVGAHAYQHNSYTIGIHLSGNFEIGTPTEAQLSSLKELCINLCAEYGIAPDREHIIGHRELMETACPGKNLYSKLDEIAQYVATNGLKNDFGEKVAAAAKEYIGVPYKEDGEDKTGICPGALAYNSYKAAECDLKEKILIKQYAIVTNGGKTFKEKEYAIEGDLVYYLKNQAKKDESESDKKNDESESDKAKDNKTETENSETTLKQNVEDCAIYNGNNEVVRVDKNSACKKDSVDFYDGDIVFVRYGNKYPLPNEMSKSGADSYKKTNQIDDGIKEKPAGGDMIILTKLPEGKTYCEPIYPDYVCVSDTVPAWALAAGVAKMTERAENPQPASETPNGEKAKDEVAPNGLNYDEDDIKKIMAENPVLTRKQAIEKLSKIDKYTKTTKEKAEADKEKAADTQKAVKENLSTGINNAKEDKA